MKLLVLSLVLVSGFAFGANSESDLKSADPNMIEVEEMSGFEAFPLNLDSEIYKQEKIFKEIVAQLKLHDLKMENSKTDLKD